MVKIAVSVLFAAAFATSVLAQDFTPSAVDEILARDAGSLSGAESDLFSRAAAKVMNDLFSREDLSEMIGRDVDELSQRDLEELLQREVDLSEEVVAARGFTEYIEDSALVARAEGEEGEGAAEGGAAPAPAPAPTSAPTPAATGTPKGAPTGAPNAPPSGPKSTVWGRVCSWFRSLFMGGPKKDDAAKKGKHAHKHAHKGAKPATPKPAAAKKPEAAPAPAKEEGGAAPAEAEGAQAPAEARAFADEDLEEFAARFYDDEAFEAREYEDFDEVLTREVDDLLERELDGVYYERDFDGVWDEELLTRALEVLEQLDQLD